MAQLRDGFVGSNGSQTNLSLDLGHAYFTLTCEMKLQKRSLQYLFKITYNFNDKFTGFVNSEIIPRLKNDSSSK